MIDIPEPMCYNGVAEMDTGRFVFIVQPVDNCISCDMSKALPMCGRITSRLFISAMTGKHIGSALLWQGRGNA